MQSHARVVVIGGGIGGLSTLYHLTQEGWTDIVLLERDELTSGTTWHSAAQCPSVAFNQLLLLLRDYTIKLYKELADDPAYPINYHYATGGMRLLTSPHHVDEVQHIISVAKAVGLNFDLLDATEAKQRNPLLVVHQFNILGYKCFNLIRASSVVNRQSTGRVSLFLSDCHLKTSRFTVSISGSLLSKH